MSYAICVRHRTVPCLTLKKLDAIGIGELSASDFYVWDIENKGPKGEYSTAVSIIMKGLK